MIFRCCAVLLLCITAVLCINGCKRAQTTADSEKNEKLPEISDVSEFSEPPETSVENEPAPDVEVIFEDDFEGEFVDVNKWQNCPETQRQGWLDVWDDDMSYLDGKGNLVLCAEWDWDEWRIRSGAVWTKDTFLSDYGYYEASIKFPPTVGIWGAFWMMIGDVENKNGSAADGIEIDIIESIEGDIGKCQHAVHWDGYADDHPRKSKIHEDIDVYDGKFHTFGLWRTEEEYIFYIDDKETWRLTAEDVDICHEPGFMLLSVEGADWVGAGTEDSIYSLPAKMLVDYVRVYKTKP